MEKICVATGSRAEYGLLKPLLKEISIQTNWQLQLLVTAMHLSPEFGLTYKQIEQDGFFIDKKVEMLLSSDTPTGIIKSMGLGTAGFADALNELSPDLLIILGDRFEMLAIAQAALILKIPIAHLHGGEITEGAYDDSIRHAITKISQLHFTSTDAYKTRVIQMGENPENVFNVGALGIDNIKNLMLFSKDEVQQKLNIKLKKLNYLITYHPATNNETKAVDEFKELTTALLKQEDSFFIFTKSNADNGGRAINKAIDDFVLVHSSIAIAFTSMGELLYLSAMQYVDGVVGNSSSGIIEAPSFNIPTINIGNRQKGRMQSQSTINCLPLSNDIEKAFQKIKTPQFKEVIKNTVNPYGNGEAVPKIINHLKNKNFKTLIPKVFFDIKF